MSAGSIERSLAVKSVALELGFDACGIASATSIDPDDHLGQWIDHGYHADMDWVTRTKAIRQDPREMMPKARSVVVVVRNYYHPRPPVAVGSGIVARYAWGRDYHKVLKKPLIKLARFLDGYGVDTPSYAAVDSGPVMERAWAERAGVGWIGKNSLVLRRDMGSWFFLGTIITEVDLNPDRPVTDHCGSCRACLEACPTDAFVSEGVLDARKCISYQTIENRGDIPADMHDKMESWIFGCDICQEVCPWNSFATESTEMDFLPRVDHANPNLDALCAMDEETFNDTFAGTPVRRTKYAGMLRNALIVRDQTQSGK